MTQEATLKHYRGVLCSFCRQPIPLPGIVERLVNGETDSSSSRGRTFNLRCRACEREKRYRMGEVAEFDGSPRTRSS
jgi:hypothetical protein